MAQVGTLSFSPRSHPHRCGQCEKTAANVFCEQCREVFCWTCAAAIHQRGKMIEHTWVDVLVDAQVVESQLQSPRQTNSIASRCFFNSPIMRPSEFSSASDGSNPSPSHLAKAFTPGRCLMPAFNRFSSAPVELESKANVCSRHPGIAAEFCCITCHGRFECAFCAASCSRDCHDMFSFFEAMEELPQRLLELEKMVADRTSELMQLTETGKSLIRHFEDMVARSRYKIESSFKVVRAAIDEDETALRMEVDSCSREVSHICNNRNAFADKIVLLMQEYEKSLEHSPVISLNVLSELRRTLCTQSQYPDDLRSCRSIAELRSQIRRGFDARRTRVDLFERDITHAPREEGRRRLIEPNLNSFQRGITNESRVRESRRMVRPIVDSSRISPNAWYLANANYPPFQLEKQPSTTSKLYNVGLHNNMQPVMSHVFDSKPTKLGVLVTGFEDLDSGSLLTEESDILSCMGHSPPCQEVKKAAPPEISESSTGPTSTAELTSAKAISLSTDLPLARKPSVQLPASELLLPRGPAGVVSLGGSTYNGDEKAISLSTDLSLPRKPSVQLPASELLLQREPAGVVSLGGSTYNGDDKAISLSTDLPLPRKPSVQLPASELLPREPAGVVSLGGSTYNGDEKALVSASTIAPSTGQERPYLVPSLNLSGTRKIEEGSSSAPGLIDGYPSNSERSQPQNSLESDSPLKEQARLHRQDLERLRRDREALSADLSLPREPRGSIDNGFKALSADLSLPREPRGSLPVSQAGSIDNGFKAESSTVPTSIAALASAKSFAHNLNQKARMRAAFNVEGDGKKDDAESNNSSSLPATPPPETVEEQDLANLDVRKTRTGRVVDLDEEHAIMKLAEVHYLEAGDLVKVNAEIKYGKKKPLEPGMEGQVEKVNKAGDVLIKFSALGSSTWVLKSDASKLMQVE